MPNGQKYEDWLNSKDREDEGENEQALVQTARDRRPGTVKLRCSRQSEGPEPRSVGTPAQPEVLEEL